jgi:hypothetical protein
MHESEYNEQSTREAEMVDPATLDFPSLVDDLAYHSTRPVRTLTDMYLSALLRREFSARMADVSPHVRAAANEMRVARFEEYRRHSL